MRAASRQGREPRTSTSFASSRGTLVVPPELEKKLGLEPGARELEVIMERRSRRGPAQHPQPVPGVHRTDVALQPDLCDVHPEHVG